MSSKANKTSKSSKTMAKKSKSKVKAEVVAEPVVTDTEAEVTEESITDGDVSSGEETETVMSISKRMATRRAQILSLQREDRADARLLERHYQQEIRELRKKKSRRSQSGGSSTSKKAPSGFAKPTEISSDLRKFLDVPDDTLLARTDVTKRITTYIKEKDLQNPDNRREIFPDEKLRKLIDIPKEYDNKLTYFNLQRCIKHHFPKSAGESASGVSAK